MKQTGRMWLVWVPPVLFLAAFLTLYFVGAERMTPAQLSRELARAYGIPQRTVLAFLEGLGPDTNLEDEFEKAVLPHGHEFSPAYSVYDTGVELVFAHLANGSLAGSDQFLQTTIVLVNDSNRTASGRIEFFDDFGNSLVLPVNGDLVSSIEFELSSRGLRRFETDGPGEVLSGWALVHTDQPVSGSLSFGIRDAAGNVATDVGIPPAVPETEFMVFADSKGDSNTGVALSNPGLNPLLVVLELRDSTGAFVASTERKLPPKGHLARFLDELYPGVIGISEFEGSLLIRSQQDNSSPASGGLENGNDSPPVAAVTLRATGAQLTSLPAVVSLPEDASWTNLAFPHLGVGMSAGLSIETSSVFYNNTPSVANVRIEYFKSAGEDLEVLVDGELGSSFDFQVPSGGVLRKVATSGGDLETGWARVTTDQPIAGSAIFSIFDDRGNISTEAGVPATVLRKEFNFIVDTSEAYNTGLALAFPLTPDQDESRSEDVTEVEFVLRDQNGSSLMSTSMELGALQHRSLFVTQLFAEVEGIDEIEGFVEVSSDEFLAPLSLRTFREKITSVPFFTREFGFAPETQVELAQNILGTEPAQKWLIHLNRNELTLDKLSVTFPGAGLNMASVQPGDFFATGLMVQSQATRLAQFIVREIGSVHFDMVTVRENGLFPQAQGRISESEGGVVLDLDLIDALPNSIIGSSVDWIFYLPADLIRLPEDLRSIVIQTDLTSVPRSEDGRASPVVRRTTQQIDLTPAKAERANLFSVAPYFIAPNEELTLVGSNFTEDAVVYFTGSAGESKALPFDVSQTEVTLFAPSDLVDGPIEVEIEGERSNPLIAHGLFVPRLEMEEVTVIDPPLEGPTEALRVAIVVPRRQLAMVDFELELAPMTFDPSSLEVGDLVGLARAGQGFPDSFEVRLGETTAEGVLLDIVEDSESPPESSILVEVFPEGIRLDFRPDSVSEEPLILTRDFLFELRLFAANFMKTEETAGLLIGSAEILSAPTGEGGAGSEITVRQSALLGDGGAQ